MELIREDEECNDDTVEAASDNPGSKLASLNERFSNHGKEGATPSEVLNYSYMEGSEYPSIIHSGKTSVRVLTKSNYSRHSIGS
jgi:hypothetical protein